MIEESELFLRGRKQAGNVRTRYVLSTERTTLRLEDLGELFAPWIFARVHAGSFVIRVFDIREKGADPRIWDEYKTLAGALAISWEEGPDVGGPYGPYRASRRRELYQHFAERLLRLGKANAYLMRKSFNGLPVPLPVETALARKLENEEEVWITSPCTSPCVKESFSLAPNLAFRSSREEVEVLLVGAQGKVNPLFAEIVDDALMEISTVFLSSSQLEEIVLREALLAALDFPRPEWRTYRPFFTFEELKAVLAREGLPYFTSVVEYGESGVSASALLHVWSRFWGIEGLMAGDKPEFSRGTLDMLFPVVSPASGKTSAPEVGGATP